MPLHPYNTMNDNGAVTVRRRATGPRTAEGKARSSRNACKHGLTAKDLVVAEHEQEEFATFHDSLRNELGPQGSLEELTFNQILHAAWNLRRFRRLESAMMASAGVDPMMDASVTANLDRLNRYARHAERSYYRGIQELRTMQTNRALRALKLEEEDEDLVPALISVNELTKQSPSELSARSLEMAMKMVNYETDVYRLRSIREIEQEKAKAA